jgi:hypothetical protein
MKKQASSLKGKALVTIILNFPTFIKGLLTSQAKPITAQSPR